MDERKWLSELRPGDEVVVLGYYGDGGTLRVVERLTKTQVVVGQTHYRLKDGRMVGGSEYSGHRIVEATPERRDQIARRQRRDFVDRALNKIGTMDLTAEQWEIIVEVLRVGLEVKQKREAASVTGR